MTKDDEEEGKREEEKEEQPAFHTQKAEEENTYRYLCCFVCTASIAIRVFLIHYGIYQDQFSNVKYTDVDYRVFTDASLHVLQNDSPYRRTTFRYTPLIAYITTLNILLHECCGKYIFAAIDLLLGYVIWRILDYRGRVSKKCSVILASIWLLNPLVFVVSTRGNADALPCLFILLFLYFSVVRFSLLFSALCFAFSIHLKIFPIIFTFSILLFLNRRYFSADWLAGLFDRKDSSTWRYIFRLFAFPFRFFCHFFSLNKKQIFFAIFSGGFFVILAAVFYLIYGYEFLFETYIYHVTRHDHRHNFSLFFYFLYLTAHSHSIVYGLLAFLPQMIATISVGAAFARTNLEMALFLQTVVFVALNKVCTSQYFLWWICLLPLALGSIELSRRSIAAVAFSLISFFFSQALWLYWGYSLEFKSMNVFLQMLLCGSVWLCASQLLVALTFIRYFKANPSEQKAVRF